LEDASGDLKTVEDMAGVEDMMNAVEDMTGAETGAEATENGIRR
jgi:hypothetical protein